MDGMTGGRGGPWCAAVVLTLALTLAACTDDGEPDPGPTAVPMTLDITTAPGAGSLGDKARADAETEVGDVLSHYLVAGFLGDYPREDFVRAFDGFTGGAASSAAQQLDLLTANRYREATSVRPTRLEARISFLVDGRDVVGGSAAVRFAFEATTDDGGTEPFTLEGRILLEEADGTWSVFGYDLVRDDPGLPGAEATS